MGCAVIGFCHVPKTGGTSITVALREAGRSVFVPEPPEGVKPWEHDWSGVHVPYGTDVVAGHIPVDQWRHFGDMAWVTVLRDPIERWVSHLHWDNRDSIGPWRLSPLDMTTRMFSPTVDPDKAAEVVSSLRYVGWTDRMADVFDWFGVGEPAEGRHKQTTRPDPIPRDLEAAAVALNPADVALWRLVAE